MEVVLELQIRMGFDGSSQISFNTNLQHTQQISR